MPTSRRDHLQVTVNALTRSPGRPRTMDRATVIRAALEIVDQEGLGALTIRRLAGELGVGAATVASAAGSKDDILGGLVDEVLTDVPEVPVLPDRWEESLLDLFTAFHELLVRHPAVAQLAVLQPTTGPVIAQTQDTIFRLLGLAEMDPERAEASYTTLTSYLMGFTLLRISRGHGGARANGSASALTGALTTDHFLEGLRRILHGFLDAP